MTNGIDRINEIEYEAQNLIWLWILDQLRGVYAMGTDYQALRKLGTLQDEAQNLYRELPEDTKPKWIDNFCRIMLYEEAAEHFVYYAMNPKSQIPIEVPPDRLAMNHELIGPVVNPRWDGKEWPGVANQDPLKDLQYYFQDRFYYWCKDLAELRKQKPA